MSLLSLFSVPLSFAEALVFQLKKRPPDYVPKKGRKQDGMRGSVPPEKLPYLVELSPGNTHTHTYTHTHTHTF